MRRWRQVRLAGLALFIFVGLSAGGVRPSRANDIFSVTLKASDQAGKPVADACFHWTLVQTGPADQEDFDLCTNDSGGVTVNYGTGFVSVTLTISQSSAPPGCSGGFMSPQTYDLTSGGDREIDVHFTCVTGGPAPGRPPGKVKPPGSADFVPITPGQILPQGTIVDVSGGAGVALTGLTVTQSVFYGDRDRVPSLFVIGPTVTGAARTAAARAAAGVVELRLTGGAFGRCKARSLQSSKPRPVRRLWGKGKGKFRTRGRYAAAAVRGTWWLTADYCNRTLVSVNTGVVAVTDLVKRKTVLVRAGQSYTALAPKKKHR